MNEKSPFTSELLPADTEVTTHAVISPVHGSESSPK
jgi:hypothetical protein